MFPALALDGAANSACSEPGDSEPLPGPRAQGSHLAQPILLPSHPYWLPLRGSNWRPTKSGRMLWPRISGSYGGSVGSHWVPQAGSCHWGNEQIAGTYQRAACRLVCSNPWPCTGSPASLMAGYALVPVLALWPWCSQVPPPTDARHPWTVGCYFCCPMPLTRGLPLLHHMALSSGWICSQCMG